MHRPPTTRGVLSVALALLALLSIAACGASGVATAVPTQPPPATPAPDTPVSGGGNAGGGDPVGVPGVPGEPTLVAPQPGLAQIHEVGAERLTASVLGREVAVRVDWWSGVEPCYALAGVDVVRDAMTFTLTVREGTADPTAACIEIAMLKGTVVQLGELEPGTYTITALGTAEPITVTVA